MSVRKTILLLDDGDTGHLRQCQAVADEAKQIYMERGIPEPNIGLETVAIHRAAESQRRWPEKLLRRIRRALVPECKRCVPACPDCVRLRMQSSEFTRVKRMRPDVVVSAGSSGWMSLWMARQAEGRSIVVMNPERIDVLREVDLAIVCRHDQPVEGLSNVVVLEGVPNLITPSTINRHGEALRAERGPFRPFTMGLLLGGDDYAYEMSRATIATLLDQLETALAVRNGDLLVTTSRRTPSAIERLLKDRLGGHPRCRLLVIANERNRAGTVEAILGTSSVVVVSPESISMVCEAACSSAEVIVYDEAVRVAERHQRFLAHFHRRSYISLVPIERLAAQIDAIAASERPRVTLDERCQLRRRLEAILSP